MNELEKPSPDTVEFLSKLSTKTLLRIEWGFFLEFCHDRKDRSNREYWKTIFDLLDSRGWWQWNEDLPRVLPYYHL